LSARKISPTYDYDSLIPIHFLSKIMVNDILCVQLNSIKIIKKKERGENYSSG